MKYEEELDVGFKKLLKESLPEYADKNYPERLKIDTDINIPEPERWLKDGELLEF